MSELIFSDDGEMFRYDDVVEALEYVWDGNLELGKGDTFTVWQGDLVGSAVENVKERKFKLTKDDEYFYFENFVEVTESA